MRRGAILSIEGLKKHFGGVVATDNVTDAAAGDL
jgi:ABC-type branched-subunit amino acid transport system ATPase component